MDGASELLKEETRGAVVRRWFGGRAGLGACGAGGENEIEVEGRGELYMQVVDYVG